MQHFSHKNGKSEHKKGGFSLNKRVRLLLAATGAVAVMAFTSGCATMNNPYTPGSPEHRRVEAQNENVNRQIFRGLGRFVEGTVEGMAEEFNILGDSKAGNAFERGLGRAAGDAAAGIVNGQFGRDQHGRKIDQGSRSTGKVYDMQGGTSSDSTVVQPQNKNGKKTYNLGN